MVLGVQVSETIRYAETNMSAARAGCYRSEPCPIRDYS